MGTASDFGVCAHGDRRGFGGVSGRGVETGDGTDGGDVEGKRVQRTGKGCGKWMWSGDVWVTELMELEVR